jgi:uncharacterized protein YjbI with pentapeptide repeats
MVEKLDPFDVEALQGAVNDSSTRVSTIWLSFIAFSAYLAAAVSLLTHRQLFLEEPIKLPTINIDLPLFASALLLPALFVLFHVYVLLQVLLLTHTATAYNEAIERTGLDRADQARLRQRLPNTLFAQMFAGSDRERGGLIGVLLRLMAWITLAVAPVLVLLTLEIKFLPYHDSVVTWTIRILIALDLLCVILLWGDALHPKRDISWSTLIHGRFKIVSCAAAAFVLLSIFLVTFPGEQHTNWIRALTAPRDSNDAPECHIPAFMARIFPANYDRIVLPGADFIDLDKIAKIEAVARDKKLKLYDGERTLNLRGRDLSCATFNSTDLRFADMSRVKLVGTRLDAANLTGARLVAANIQAGSLVNVRLDEANMAGADLRYAKLDNTTLRGSDLSNTQLQRTSLVGAKLQGANLNFTRLVGADLAFAELQGASFIEADLSGALFEAVQLQGANFDQRLHGPFFHGAVFDNASLQGATIGGDLSGAWFKKSQIQGADLRLAVFNYTYFYQPFVWRSVLGTSRCDGVQIIDPRLDTVVEIDRPATKPGIQEPPSPAELDKHIEKTIKDVPHDRQESLSKTLRTRLADPLPNWDISQDFWNQCPKQALSAAEFSKGLTQKLVEIVCEKGQDKEYLAEALYIYWVDERTFREDDAAKPDKAGLARGLLGLDNKPCPGASELSETIRAQLRKALEPPPSGPSPFSQVH